MFFFYDLVSDLYYDNYLKLVDISNTLFSLIISWGEFGVNFGVNFVFLKQKRHPRENS